jgi:hypothetical protein
MLVAGGQVAQAATGCNVDNVCVTSDQAYATLQTDIAANVPARFQTPFAGLATLAQRLQPGDPIIPSDPVTPATLRPFIPSALVLRVLWEGNRALAGTAGYSCASAATISTDIASFRPFFTIGNLSLLNFTLTPSDPLRCR